MNSRASFIRSARSWRTLRRQITTTCNDSAQRHRLALSRPSAATLVQGNPSQSSVDNTRRWHSSFEGQQGVQQSQGRSSTRNYVDVLRRQIESSNVLRQAQSARSHLVKVLHGRRNGYNLAHDNDAFRVIESTVLRRILLNDEGIPVEISADIINLCVQYYVVAEKGSSPPKENIDRAHALFWFLIQNKERFFQPDQEESASILLCDSFAAVMFAMRSNDHQTMQKRAKMVRALLDLALTDSKRFELTTHAMNRVLHHYMHAHDVDNARKTLEYMINSWKNGKDKLTPNLQSFNMLLQCCGTNGESELSIKVIHEMVKLYKEDKSNTIQPPNHHSVLHVLASHTKGWGHKIDIKAGEKAEEFLKWSLACHEDGTMDLTKISLSSALTRAMEAWSNCRSPEAGPRTDVLLQKIKDQYIAGGKLRDQAPVPLQFASNAKAWINALGETHTPDSEAGKRFRAILKEVEEHGIAENWKKSDFFRFFWAILIGLDGKRVHLSNKEARDLMYDSLDSMVRLELDVSPVYEKYPFLQKNKE